jgi:hypothetical protein
VRFLLANYSAPDLYRVVLGTFRCGDGPGTAVAVDRTGRSYTDLTDFRAHNDLLTPDDLVMTSADLTGVPGGPSVVVTGHTPPTWPWGLLGGIIALVSVLAAVLVLLRRRAKARFDTLFGPGAT